jgi:hypothetical protein
VWSTAFNVDKIIDTFQKQLKQKQSPEFIKTLFELAVKNITVYPDKIKVALLVTQEKSHRLPLILHFKIPLI